MTAVLDVRGLSVHYGGVIACHEVDLRVEPGQMVGLVGPNGAGKTTLIDAVTGFTRTTGDSRVELLGEPIDGLKPHQRFQRGLARTFQSVELFNDLTILENLLISAETPKWSDLVRDLFTTTSTEVIRNAMNALELVGLADRAEMTPSELSTGERKLAAVARSLASQPKALLLDEPAAGLDTSESEQLGNELQRIRDSGIAILLIDHDMSLIFAICDPIYVLEFGQIIAVGSPHELRTNPRVVEAYLGQPDAADIIETSDDDTTTPGSIA